MTSQSHPQPVTPERSGADLVTVLVDALQRRKQGIQATSPPCRASRSTISTVATSIPSTVRALDREVAWRTRLAVAVTLRDLHRYAMNAMQATLTDDDPHGGNVSRRLALLAKRVKVMRVILDRVHGTPWCVIARQHNRTPAEVERIYGPMEAAWRAGSRAPWAPHVPGVDVLTGLMPIDMEDAEAAVLPYLCLYDQPRLAP